MNYVFISPHFPDNFKNFVFALKNHGVNVLGIASEPYDNLDYGLRESLTEYYKVEDMEDYDQLLRACGYFISKYGRIDYIESQNEHWLETDAKLRTDFNVPGYKIKDLPPIKQKSEMKKVFQKANIPVAKGKVIKNIEEARKFIDKVDYPICAKPNIGVGASGTYKITKEEELISFFENKPEEDYIFEEFITGSINTFDGLIDKDGTILFLSSFVYPGIMEVVQENLDLFYYNQVVIPDDLMDAGLKAVKEFGIIDRFFHLEFFRTERDEIVALEINVRPPGGWSLDMFNYANDMDVYDLYAKMIANKEIEPFLDIKYHCAFIGTKYNIEPKLSHSIEENLNSYGDVVVQHGPMAEIFSPVMGNYSYILRSTDFNRLKEAGDFVTERI